MTMSDALFQPFACKGLRLPNRIVMAPMTRSFSPGGVPGADVAAYYRTRAEAGVGLIVTEGTGVNRPGATNDPAVPHFHGEAALAGWAEVVRAVHAAGGLIAPQLWHVGSAINPANRDDSKAESPSGLYKPGRPWGQAMREVDISDTIEAFAQGAADAKRLGFDAVELHGAHGYLIDQFFWEGSNQRSDTWGGADLPARGRFACELVTAVRAAVGPDYPVILRLSQWKQQDYEVKLAHDPEAMLAWLAPLLDAGVDILHCSQRRFWEAEFPGIDGAAGLNFAGWAKKLTGAPTITVGSIGLTGEFIAGFGGEVSEPAGLEALLGRLERDEFDLVAVGRGLIVNPDWVEKVRSGRADALVGFDRGALATLI